MSHLSLSSPLALAAAVGACLGLSAPSVEACGGLFCSAANPVNQAAERIIFANNGDGSVTAAIEIQYEGPSEQFAWVLPVPPGQIEVGVSSKVAFDRIDQASNPSYFLSRSFDEGCDFPAPPSASPGDSTDEPISDEGVPSPDDVLVLAEGNAGPYDWQQLMVNPDLDDPADVAIQWLTDNGYDVGELGPDVLRPYLQQDMNLVAFRLTKGNQAGSIRPIMIRYESAQPFIPIRPTAVAANPDMGVKVWVLGDSRAIPQNYLHLELNEALINWFNPNANYNAVIIAAADEAGGHGFVTEQAGPAAQFSELAFSSFDQQIWEELQTAPFSSMQEFIELAVSRFNTYDGFLDVMSDPGTVPLRDGATAEQLITCVSCYFQEDVPVRNEAFPSTPYDPSSDPLLDMDVPAFLAEMERLVIAPLADTRALFEDNSTVTRLYTTLSADEMTVDPAFDFNPELEDVAQQRTANQVMQCSSENEWRIEFESGLVLEGNGNTWPVSLDSGIPLNLRILQLSTTGDGDVVEDNIAIIGGMLADLGVGDVDPDVSAPEPTQPDDEPAMPDPEPMDPAQPTETDTEEHDAGVAPPSPDDTDTDDVTDETRVTDDNDEGEQATELGADESAADDGCGCTVVGSDDGSHLGRSWIALLGLAALLRRRRRAADRSSQSSSGQVDCTDKSNT